MLIKVNAGKGETYLEISLDDIAEISVSRSGEPGHLHVRGAHSYVKLKSGEQHLTDAAEAQRIVDAMRERDDKNAK